MKTRYLMFRDATRSVYTPSKKRIKSDVVEALKKTNKPPMALIVFIEENIKNNIRVGIKHVLIHIYEKIKKPG